MAEVTGLRAPIGPADQLPSAGNTPLLEIPLVVGGIPRHLRLKAEWLNPCGSIKDRTAEALLASVADWVDPRVGVIESTSGNLGLALAQRCRGLGFPFTAVVDPRSSGWLVRGMRDCGARIICVDQPDGVGGYLLSRLATVRRLCEEDPRLTWTNQYQNPANPAAHERTAAELSGQASSLQAVFAAVSTGGTLCGIDRFARRTGQPWRAVGVDVHGSVALGGTPGPRCLSGIGSSRRSEFVPPGPDAPTAELVSTDEALACCDWAEREFAIGLGSSSGATLAAALRQMRADRSLIDVACICPDGAERYRETAFDPEWRRLLGVRPDRAWRELAADVRW